MSSHVITQADIAICTWNRDLLLAQTLDSLIKLRVPDCLSLTVLIVDNNSTDDTRNVIERFDAAIGEKTSVVSLKEPSQGHTYCRNTAIESATGQLMLWTDDDVILAPDWLERYVAATEADSDAVFWGSVIEPIFQSGRPDWIEQNWVILKACFAHRDLGDQPVSFDPTRLPYGANFAIRTDAQREFRYATELGRRGDAVLGEDELDLFRRLLAAGYRGNWVPGAVVEHVIPPQRASEKYVYDYFVGQGRALVAKGEPWHVDVAKLKSESRAQYIKYKLKRPLADSKTWVSHMIRSALAQGQYEALTSEPSTGG
jgi:glycosyltransferase involved in cell wall biosynthesis